MWQDDAHGQINQHRIIPAASTEPRLPRADRRRTMSRILVAALVITLGVAAQTQGAQDTPRSATAAAITPLNLNSASVAQLEALPGIGRATAERIVEYRQKNGAFKKAEDLMNVRGIGEKSFLKLKPLVTVAAARTVAP
jgi:competence protein ComEA